MTGLGKGLGALISTNGMSSVSSSSLKKELKDKEKELKDLIALMVDQKKEVEDLRKDLTIQLMLEGKVDKTLLFQRQEDLKFCFDEKERLEIEIERLKEKMGTETTRSISGEREDGSTTDRSVVKPSEEIDMRMVKDLMFGSDNGPGNFKVEEKTTSQPDDDHIGDMIKELDQSRQADIIRKEAYGSTYPEGNRSSTQVGYEETRPASSISMGGKDPYQARPLIRRKVVRGGPKVTRSGNRSDIGRKDANLYRYIEDAQKCLSVKDIDSAKVLLHEALREYPLDDELLYHLGNVFFLEGDLEQAEVRFRKSAGSNPKSFRAFNNLGVVLRKKGERESAIQAFNMALEQNEEYERAWLNLGTIFMEIDPPMLNEARIFLRRALECDPDLDQAKEKLEECERLLSTNT